MGRAKRTRPLLDVLDSYDRFGKSVRFHLPQTLDFFNVQPARRHCV